MSVSVIVRACVLYSAPISNSSKYSIAIRAPCRGLKSYEFSARSQQEGEEDTEARRQKLEKETEKRRIGEPATAPPRFPDSLFPLTRYAPRFTPYEGFMVLTNQERSRSLVCHEKKCRCRGCYRNCGPAIFSGPAESSVV